MSAGGNHRSRCCFCNRNAYAVYFAEPQGNACNKLLVFTAAFRKNAWMTCKMQGRLSAVLSVCHKSHFWDRLYQGRSESAPTNRLFYVELCRGEFRSPAYFRKTSAFLTLWGAAFGGPFYASSNQTACSAKKSPGSTIYHWHENKFMLKYIVRQFISKYCNFNKSAPIHLYNHTKFRSASKKVPRFKHLFIRGIIIRKKMRSLEGSDSLDRAWNLRKYHTDILQRDLQLLLRKAQL